MKTRSILPLLTLVLITASLTGCARKERYGAAVPVDGALTTGTILANPASYTNQAVVVAGRITLECPTGCWFEMDSGSGALFVNIAGAGLAIPQRVGRKVRVIGHVKPGDSRPELAGEGVVIQ